MVERVQGAVKFFKSDKGFGFCTRKDAPDVFIHARELKRCGINVDPDVGDVLEFDVVPGREGKGPSGANFKFISTPRGH